MIFIIENGQLDSDMDAQGNDILNVGNFTPVPQNLVSSIDTRMSDARAPLPGSVTNDSVANAAAIDQSKINFNASIPPSWLGSVAGTAAPGDQAEFLVNKGVPDGYAALDSGGKVPVGQLPATIGTITSINLAMPADFTVSGGPITSTGTITVAWANVADGSWFGNSSGGSAPPTFQTTPIPVSLVPNLDASKITSGTIAAARLPAAVGVGVSHAPGLVPDPGASGTATDYLARDMTYKAVPSIGPTYQPTVPNPTFGTTSGGGTATVNILDSLAGAAIFYSLTSGSTGFLEYTTMLSFPTPQSVWAYASKAGYNNSSVVTVSL